MTPGDNLISGSGTTCHWLSTFYPLIFTRTLLPLGQFTNPRFLKVPVLMYSSLPRPFSLGLTDCNRFWSQFYISQGSSLKATKNDTGWFKRKECFRRCSRQRPHTKGSSQIIPCELATPHAALATAEHSKPPEVPLTILNVTSRTLLTITDASGRWLLLL